MTRLALVAGFDVTQPTGSRAITAFLQPKSSKHAPSERVRVGEKRSAPAAAAEAELSKLRGLLSNTARLQTDSQQLDPDAALALALQRDEFRLTGAVPAKKSKKGTLHAFFHKG